MNVDTLAPLGHSLAEAKNQKTIERPQMSGLKVTHCVEAIKKIWEHDLHRLEAMVGIPFT